MEDTDGTGDEAWLLTPLRYMKDDVDRNLNTMNVGHEKETLGSLFDTLKLRVCLYGTGKKRIENPPDDAEI